MPIIPRTHQRIPLRVAVQINYGTTRIDAFTRDVSLGGMFIELPTPPPYGTEVTVTLVPSRGAVAISIKATVRWATEEGIGAHFGAMGAKETWVLNQLTSRRRLDQVQVDDTATAQSHLRAIRPELAASLLDAASRKSNG